MPKLSLRSRILLAVTIACGLCATVSIWGFLYFNRLELEKGILSKARTIQSQLDAATDYVAKQGGLPDVVSRMVSKYKSSDELTSADKQEILKQVPIYAALEIGRLNADRDRYRFRVFSDEPRRPENLASPSELEIFRKFEKNSALTEFQQNDGQTITVFRPVRLKSSQGCLTCHGDPATSPWKNGKDVLGFKMENWTDGKLHGVFAISQNVAHVIAASSDGERVTPGGWLIMGIVSGALIAMGLSISLVARPIADLGQVAKCLSSANEKVHAASSQIAIGSDELAQASSEQAASLTETAASIEEMSSMVSKNSDNARLTAATTERSRLKVEEGRKVVAEMIRSMQEIDQSNQNIVNQVERSNLQMNEIVTVIGEIAEKTKVINEIVFQTKLLSFNASVEAARAGDQGKGFAVVAEEVGNLARMSGDAAHQISELLGQSTHKVSEIAARMRDQVQDLVVEGKSKVAQGTTTAQRCGEVLGEIVEDVSRVSAMASDISTASVEQAKGVQELTKAMHQLDEIMRQNSTASELSARSAHELEIQSTSLSQAVGYLQEALGTPHSVCELEPVASAELDSPTGWRQSAA